MRPLLAKSQAGRKGGPSSLAFWSSEGKAALLEEMLYSQLYAHSHWSRRAAREEAVVELGTMATEGQVAVTSSCVGVQDWLWEPHSKAGTGESLPAVQQLPLLVLPHWCN